VRFDLKALLAKQVPYHLSHTSSPFCSGYFGDGVLRRVFLDWPGTSICISSLGVMKNAYRGLLAVWQKCGLMEELIS
jgi:hypothetical protein